MNTRTPFALTLTAAAAALALAGCTAGPDEPAGPATEPATAPQTEPAAPAPSRDPEDVAADFLRELENDGEHITGIDVPEPGRLTIETDLTDPGRDTAPESLLARSICEAGARVDGIEYVAVQEQDGTTWVLYGHPAFGNECVIP